jgi:hypothetical protein
MITGGMTRAVTVWVPMLAAGCARDLVCGADIPLTGRAVQPAEEASIRRTVAELEAWADFDVCLTRIEVSARLRAHGHDIAGGLDEERRWIGLDRDVDLASHLRHELCHLVDHDRDITGSHPDRFVPPEGVSFDPTLYADAAARRGEYFAELCALGPILPPLVAAVEGSCGDPLGQVAEHVWWNPPWPGGAVRIATPAVDRTRVADLDRLHSVVSDRLLASSAPHQWIHLDDQVQPESSVAAPPTMSGGWVDATIPRSASAGGPDELLWVRGEDAPPQRVSWDGTLAETALEPREWRGGWHEDRLWLWDGDDPHAELVEATPEGQVVGRSAPPDPAAMRRSFTVWDGEPAMIVIDSRASHIVRLPDGEVLAELPTPMVPRREIDGVRVGDYNYAFGEDLFTLDRDLPPNLHIGGLRRGSVWIAPDGRTFASSECVEGLDPGVSDGVTAQLPVVTAEIVSGAIQTTLHRETVTWPIPTSEETP